MNPRLWSVAIAMTLSQAALAHGQAGGMLTRVSGGEVIVSARQARLVFPPEKDSVWWWHASRYPGTGYSWWTSPLENPLGINAEVARTDTLARTYRSLDSLARVIRLVICPAQGTCRTSRDVVAETEGRAMAIVIRDTSVVQAMFRIRRDSIALYATTPTGGTWTKAKVRYVDPQLPAPDAAHIAHVDSIRSGEPQQDLYVVAMQGRSIVSHVSMIPGDTVQLQVRSLRSDASALSVRWEVSNPNVARIVASSPSTATVRGVAEGKTEIVGRVAGQRLPAQSSIVVTRPIRRLQIVADTAFYAGESGAYQVLAFDDRGVPVEGVTVEVTHEQGNRRGGSTMESTLPGGPKAATGLRQAGVRTFIARVGSVADTLRVNVRPRRPPPSENDR